MYAERVTDRDSMNHAAALHNAYQRIGDGSLRPGPHCKYCPAKDSCPAKDGELLIKASALVRSVTQAPLAAPVDKGQFHMFLGELAKLERRAREQLKEDVLAGEVIQRPDGQYLTVEKRTVRNLSMASVVRAYGKIEGAKTLKKLEKAGAIEVNETEYLVARGGK